MHIMECNFFRFMEQRTLTKKMTTLITTSVRFYLPRTILKSPGPSVLMEKSRESRVKILSYRESLPCYESKS
jgi:hypothetical protein